MNDDADRTTSGLTAKLTHLLGEDATAYANLLDLPEKGMAEARQRHNDRTARYKLGKALSLAPDSEAIAQACCYMVLRSISLGGEAAIRIAARLAEMLVAAGYDKEEAVATVGRLVPEHSERELSWRRRTRQRLARQVIEALSQQEGGNSETQHSNG